MSAESAKVGTNSGASETVRAIGSRPLRIEELLEISRGAVRVELDTDPAYRRRLARTREAVERAQDLGRDVYGVTTGVGASLGVPIPRELREDMASNLMRFHGCGTGRMLDELESAAVLAVRLATLARGNSGVREVLLERMCDLLNDRVLPRIPEEGSVGASGDLTPLSYLASLLSVYGTVCG